MHRTILEALHRTLAMPAAEVEDEQRLQRAVHEQSAITFVLAAEVDVVVNAMRVESERREPKEHHGSRNELASPRRVLRCGFALRWSIARFRAFAIHDVVL